ncbi:MAG: alpha/beta superfamily hydrolase [Flavobacteriaceae bacterium]|jgi:alpha/beta superfamily hydrolase
MNCHYLGAMKALILIILFLPITLFSQIDGEWHGSFVVMGQATLLDLSVTSDTAHQSITISDPEGAFKDMSMVILKLDDATISFEAKQIGATYKGDYFVDGDSIYGTMRQGDVLWTISFHREEQEMPAINRPQEPKEPYAFTQEEVMVPNGDISLGATLTLPINYRSDLPIVILASGSGPQNRDCYILGHKPFFVIAEHFAKKGIATLRFDDRGVNESSGDYKSASVEDFASDVEACVKYISSQKRFKKNLLGLAGHSEGGIHTLMAAKGNRKVDFILQLAAVGTSGRGVLVEQQYLIPIQSGNSEELSRWNQSVFDGMCAIVSKYAIAEAQDSLTTFLGAKYDSAPEEYTSTTGKLAFMVSSATFINNEWARQFVAFETADYLKKIKVPILCIAGGADIQVPAESNIAGFEQNFSKKSSKHSKTIIVPGLNHLFQQCESCKLEEYGELSETFSPIVLNHMSDWIKEIQAL